MIPTITKYPLPPSRRKPSGITYQKLFSKTNSCANVDAGSELESTAKSSSSATVNLQSTILQTWPTTLPTVKIDRLDHSGVILLKHGLSESITHSADPPASVPAGFVMTEIDKVDPNGVLILKPSFQRNRFPISLSQLRTSKEWEDAASWNLSRTAYREETLFKRITASGNDADDEIDEEDSVDEHENDQVNNDGDGDTNMTIGNDTSSHEDIENVGPGNYLQANNYMTVGVGKFGAPISLPRRFNVHSSPSVSRFKCINST